MVLAAFNTSTPFPLLVRPAVLVTSGVLIVRVLPDPSTRMAKSFPAAEGMSEVPPLMVLLPPVSRMPVPAAVPMVSDWLAASVRLLAPSILRELIEALVWAVMAPVTRL